MSTQSELPKYSCHKEVWALKIEKVDKINEGGAIIFPVNKLYAPFGVSQEYISKHNPQPGGYYVMYKDGYKSFSPADAFEGGYTLMD